MQEFNRGSGKEPTLEEFLTAGCVPANRADRRKAGMRNAQKPRKSASQLKVRRTVR